MIDYPENIAPTGQFKQLYCYNEQPAEESFFYAGNGFDVPQYQSGFEGSRRADVQYRTDVVNPVTENPFDRNAWGQNNSSPSEPINYWAQNDNSHYQYQTQYPNSYFDATHTDRPLTFDMGRPGSRRDDVLPNDSLNNGFSYENPYYQNTPYPAFNQQTPYDFNMKPSNVGPNGYSYNNPYASALGMEITGFDRHTSSNWSNQFVEERPIQAPMNPWRNSTTPYDNRYQAFERSLQPTIPPSAANDDPFAGWAGYAEKNWPKK
jgi:hypothetical protein